MNQSSRLRVYAGEAFLREGTVAQGRAGNTEWYVNHRIGRGGCSEGVRIVEIANGLIAIDVLLTRGMGIWRVRRGQTILGWQPPNCLPVHPAFVSLTEPSGLGWLDGFNELLCRCGLESNGPPEFDDAGRLLRPLHGRIANLPAHSVELLVDEDAGRLMLRGSVDESRFHFQSLRLETSITTTFGSKEFSWSDEVKNIGGREALMQMLYHFNVGLPLLRPEARILAPVAAVAPLTQAAAREGVERWHIMPPPRSGSAEQVYCLDLAADQTGNTRVLLDGLTGGEAVEMRFNKQALPCFTLWRNTPDQRDGYVVGLEPGTNFPNPRSFEQRHGRVVTLAKDQSWRASVAVAWHTDSKAIASAQDAIHALQAEKSPQIATKPRADWSAHA